MRTHTVSSATQQQQHRLTHAARRPPSVAAGVRATCPARLRCNSAAAAVTKPKQAAQSVAVAAPPPSQEQQQQHVVAEQQHFVAPRALPRKQQLPQQLPQQQPGVQGVLRRAQAAVVGAFNAVDPRVRALVMLNLMTLLMSSNWVVIKDSNDTFDPMLFTSLRFTLAAAAFTPFLMKGFKSKAVRDAGLEIGVWTALGYLTQAGALFLTPASRASLLSTFTVLAVPCLAGLSGQRVKPLVWACGLAALAGTTLLEQGGGEPPNAGDLLSILSALFFAMQIFRTEAITRHLPKGSNLPFMSITLATIAVASCAGTAVVHAQDAAASLAALGAVLGTALSSLGPGDSPAGAAQPLWELMYTSFCSTDLVLLIELVALQSVSSTEAALIYSLEPVGGAAMAWAFLGERWGPMGWWGAGLILAASLACQLGGAIDESDSSGGSGSEPKEQEAAS